MRSAPPWENAVSAAAGAPPARVTSTVPPLSPPERQVPNGRENPAVRHVEDRVAVFIGQVEIVERKRGSIDELVGLAKIVVEHLRPAVARQKRDAHGIHPPLPLYCQRAEAPYPVAFPDGPNSLEFGVREQQLGARDVG